MFASNISQKDINEALLGEFADFLPPAEYNLSSRRKDRGVYTFCMCPGRCIVAAVIIPMRGLLLTNGMSFRARDGKNANSAMCVSVIPSDYGSDVNMAIEFQRMLEEKAFCLGGSRYGAPMQTVGGFLTGKHGTEPSRIIPTYRSGDVVTADMHMLFPECISSMLEIGLHDFGKKIRGFDVPDAVLCGVESRTSSPVRILRGANRAAIGHADIYPCGEGADMPAV